MTNLPTIDEIARDPGVIKTLSLDAIDALIFNADEYAKRGSTVKRALQTEVENRYSAEIGAAYMREGKDTGSVRIAATDGYEVVAERAKKVEWDQSKLRAVGDAIYDAGDDPKEYIETTLTVPERKFTAWPEHIRRQFEPARTLKPATTTIKLAKREAA